MKQLKSILLTFLIILSAFSTIVYTSCRDSCKGVICLNGGTCNNGGCICPSGYSGRSCEYADQATIIYNNNTFTPIDITVNGQTTTIPVAGSVSYVGDPGGTVNGTASTSGATTSGSSVGLTVYWSLSGTFPLSGTAVQNLDVTADYFFLRVRNNSAYSITKVYVNYGLSHQTLDNVFLDNTGITYDIGYYSAWSNSNVHLVAPSGGSWDYNIGLPFTLNQSYTFTAL